MLLFLLFLLWSLLPLMGLMLRFGPPLLIVVEVCQLLIRRDLLVKHVSRWLSSGNVNVALFDLAIPPAADGFLRLHFTIDALRSIFG